MPLDLLKDQVTSIGNKQTNKKTEDKASIIFNGVLLGSAVGFI
jgi:hypothetical protein